MRIATVFRSRNPQMQRQLNDTDERKRHVSDVLEQADSLDELNGIRSDYDPEETAGELSDDDVFEVLYNRRRRDVIAYLREQDGASTVSDIAEHIAAEENETTVQQLSSYERKRVYVGLYQNHLPMMKAVGVIDYDKNRGTVQLRECASQLEPFLDDTDSSNVARLKAAGAVGLAGVILFGVLNVGTFAAVPDLLWLALGGAGLFGLPALEAYGPA